MNAAPMLGLLYRRKCEFLLLALLQLATSMLGIIARMYSVVLVGILVGKYAAGTREPSP